MYVVPSALRTQWCCRYLPRLTGAITVCKQLHRSVVLPFFALADKRGHRWVFGLLGQLVGRVPQGVCTEASIMGPHSRLDAWLCGPSSKAILANGA